jgi:hypothetical protein
MLEFDAIGKRGDEITLRYGEELSPDGSVRYDMRCNCKYEEKMILSGGRDTLMQFDYKAFRYAEILYPDSVTLENIKMRVRHYPFSKSCEYNTENERLRSVLDLCINTIKYSTQERFLDCLTREKGAYFGDLMASGRAHATLTGDLTLLKHALTNFNDTAFICEGIMATAGTVSSGSYQEQLQKLGLDFAVPDSTHQQYLHELIYDDVKSGRDPDLEKFYKIVDHLKEKGCDKLILGCTELSLINRAIGGDPIFCDSLEVLAYTAIKACGSETVGFSEDFKD